MQCGEICESEEMSWLFGENTEWRRIAVHYNVSVVNLLK